MKKINLGLVFGGKSGEHEISLLSAQSIFKALDKNKYNIYLIAISKQGDFMLMNKNYYLLNPDNLKLIKINEKVGIKITFIYNQNQPLIYDLKSKKIIDYIDVFFPIIHGTYGEDGCLQGFFEILNVAYVGSEVLGSVIGMAKDIQKTILQKNKINVANFLTINYWQFKKRQFKALKTFIKKYHWPVFVKPGNLGSSVAVNKVNNEKQINKALKEVFVYDEKALIEQYIKGKEVECSIIGNDKPSTSKTLAEIIPSKKYEFYSYQAKYLDENGAQLLIPARIDKKTTEKIKKIALKTYQLLQAKGFARIDFFVDKNNKVYVNEINTLPGFTNISMFPKLLINSGFSYQQIIDKLIQLALERKKFKDKLLRNYQSNK